MGWTLDAAWKVISVGRDRWNVQEVQQRAEQFGDEGGSIDMNPERIASYGGSAGAGISLWLGFHEDLADPESEDPVCRQSPRVVAVGTMNGQSSYDLIEKVKSGRDAG